MKYVYPVKKLFAGSSLGNLFTFVQLDPQSNIHGIWSSIDNSYYLGNLSIEFFSNSEKVTPRSTVFEPSSQTTLFETTGLQITKRVELPFSDDLNAKRDDLQKVSIEIEAKNLSDFERNFRIIAKFHFPAVSSPLFTKKPPREETGKKYKIQHNSRSLTAHETLTSRRTLVRFSEPAASYVTDSETAYVQFDPNLSPHESVLLRIIVCIDPSDAGDLKPDRHGITEAECNEEYPLMPEDLLYTSDFITPSGTINRGIYWAKVNTLRVQHKFRSGYGFTNDPPQDIVVVRDLAWYIMGCDYISPLFSRKLIDLTEENCFHQDGKLTEFVHADETIPELHDYDLNINDDTPLFILALEHHALLSGDSDFSRRAFKSAVLAAHYILSQIRDGLVSCDAKGTNVRGIASWRNIIDGYNLTGYVTEINAECCAALHATACLANMVGEKTLAEKYESEAQKLESHILAKLRNNSNGLFHLNIDQEGYSHSDVTGDLVFPALFGIGDERLRLGISDRLLTDDIWTSYGARTVAKTDPSYDPESGMNLMGGIWPNLTAWFAMAAKEFYPEKVAEAMETIYRISEVDSPVQFGNLIPGEFPERLHGENYKSMGMGMSPWMPPTYVWLGVEGLLGLRVEKNSFKIEPSMPHDWKFLCVFNIPIRGQKINVVVYDGMIYTDMKVESELPTRIGTFRPITNSADLRMFEFSDDIGVKRFAFSSSGYEGKLSIPVNSHSINVNLKLSANELKEVVIHETD